MSAIADKGYIQAQLKAAEQARKRLTIAATRVFGEKQGRTVLQHVAKRAARRLREENPEIFSESAAGRRRP